MSALEELGIVRQKGTLKPLLSTIPLKDDPMDETVTSVAADSDWGHNGKKGL